MAPKAKGLHLVQIVVQRDKSLGNLLEPYSPFYNSHQYRLKLDEE